MRFVKKRTHLLNHLAVLLGLFAAALAPLPLLATHIVGGEMGYRILQTTPTEVTVEITLAVYRDCFFGNPEVYFDQPAFIGVFNDSDRRIRQLVVDFQGQDDTLTNQLDTFCLVNQDPVCVHTTTYVTTVTLPREGTGYTFAYQRCCRNETVANVVEPLNVGATYSIRLSPEAMARGNESPVFRNWPPIYICAGQPLLFDHSAIDSDGDSLVYSLCTPFAGADMDMPKPVPTPNPPYEEIPWAPGFSIDNALGVGEPLRIDALKGEMTAVPGARGQYVVGVCVEEYDRVTGELLSRVRRDFQYNINPCEDLTASWSGPDTTCDGLSVTFANTSVAPEEPTFQWFFDWPFTSSSEVVSSTDSVTYTFPEPGTYTVALVAEPDAICADTFFREITISDGVVADFETTGSCDGLVVGFADLSENATEWMWDFGDGNFSTEQNPTHTFGAPGTYKIRLEVSNEFGCTEIAEKEIVVEAQPLVVGFGGELECTSEMAKVSFESTVINPFGGDVTYDWTFSAGMPSTSTEENPVVTLTESATLFAELTVSTENGCSASFSDTIEVVFEQFNFPDTLVFCENLGPFLNPEGGKDGYTYRWSPGTRLFPDSTVANPKARPEQDTWYYVTVTPNGAGCTIVDSVFVQVPTRIGLNLGPQIKEICDDSLTITATADVDLDMLTIQYFSSETGLIGTGSSITFSPSSPIDTVTAIATDTFGCTDRDRMIIINNSLAVELDTEELILCVGESGTLTVINSDPNDILTYSWNSALIQGATDQAAATVVGDTPGTFVVEVAVENQEGCTKVLTATVVVAQVDPPNLIGDTTICPGASVALNPNADENLTYEWSPLTDLDVSNAANPVATPTEDRTYSVTVTDPETGCTAMNSVTVFVSAPIDLSISPGNGDTTFCESTPLMLMASGTGIESIRWFEGTDLNSSIQTGVTIIVSPTSGVTTYTAIAENMAGCTDTATYTVTIIDFMPEMLPDQVVCAGDEVDLNPNDVSGVTFTFSPSIGIDSSDPLNPMVTLQNDQTYFVTLTDPGSGCTKEDTVNITTVDKVAIEIQPGDTTLCEDQSLTLTATTDRAGLISWFAEEPFVDTLSTLDMLTITFSAGSNTIFAVAEDSLSVCPPDTAMITVTVTDLELPPIPDTTICLGASAVLNSEGDTTLNYQWSPSIGLSATDVARPIATVEANQTYFVTITDGSGLCSTLDTVEVIVQEDLGLEVTPEDSTFCGPTEIDLFANTNIGAVIDWYIGTDTSGMEDATGNVFNDVQLVTGTNVITIIASRDECSELITRTFVVSEIPPVPESGPLTVCTGDSVSLNPDGDSNFTYNWAPAEGLNATDVANPSASPMSDQTYSVTVTDASGFCSATAEVEVQVATGVMVDLVPADTLFCIDTLVTLTATANQAVTFEWFLQDGSAEPIQVNTEAMMATLEADLEVGANTYFVVASNAGECPPDTAMTTLTLSDMIMGLPEDTVAFCPDELDREVNPEGLPQFQYDWSPTAGLDLSTTPHNPIFTANESRQYFVVVTDPMTGCTALDTVDVLIQPSIVPDAGEDMLFCDPNNMLTLSATSAVDEVSFEWFQDGGSIGTGASIEVLPPNGETIYVVSVTDRQGCTELDSLMVDNRPVLATIPQIGPFCAPDDLGLKEIQVTSATGEDLMVTWNTEGVVSDPGMAMVTVDLNVANTFSALVSNEFGCTAELSTTIGVINLVDSLSGRVEPSDTIFLGEEFTLLVDGCDNCSFDWTLPDGMTFSAGDSIVHEPLTGGEQVYQVTVTEQVSAVGCSTDIELRGFVSLVICDETRVFLPNAFTPNGDGFNDVLEIRSNFRDQLTINEFVIFNRQGEVVFMTDDPNEGWDGTFMNSGGPVLPPDVFSVSLSVTCPGGETLVQQQSVTLIR